jgi:hypothetical protein
LEGVVLAHTCIASTQRGGGNGGSRELAKEGMVQARQPENIEGRWVLAAALERI